MSQTSRSFTLAVFVVLFAAVPAQADQPVFPGKVWAVRPPREVGLDAAGLDRLRDLMGGRGCVVRHGYLVYSWGDPTRSADVASACKPVFVHFVFKAIEEGRISSIDAPVVRWERRLNGLNAALGCKDRTITWRHLACQTSCYGVREAPGTAYDYSDFNMALLFDTLMEKVYGAAGDRVDADVLHPRLTDLLEFEDGPTLMAFGAKDRPGRLGISVRDFARFGLLYLRRGQWNGRQIIRREHAVQAVTSPVAAAMPRTHGEEAEMIPGQRSLGGGNNQTDHFASYSFAWWIKEEGTGSVAQTGVARTETLSPRCLSPFSAHIRAHGVSGEYLKSERVSAFHAKLAKDTNPQVSPTTTPKSMMPRQGCEQNETRTIIATIAAVRLIDVICTRRLAWK
jgi:CubicO group peptidase (beta-lactamase class C family)